ncbi:Acyl-CoA dehydrogenase [Saccharopolyspora shandongensis]|uniref:Acyl-CoA dehydrogenase n=2 Tax=Saccharopolyspora shandongensis TaxID=418495 RepID=A0A1H3G745_9PSEU|nr:Acyl-CoA dehydrogenase [Saccharopolyspora shandongensis]
MVDVDVIAQIDAYFCTPRHRQLRDDVRRFAQTEIAPHVPAMETDQQIQYELAHRIAAQGWLGPTISGEYGGMGEGHVAKTIIDEEVSTVSAPMGAMVQASQLGTAKIIHYGTLEQRRRWLPAIARGDVLPTIAVTEPTSGGHVLGMTTSARRDGDDYILNGRKVYVGNSHVGTLHGVVARTGAGKNLTAFLVEADRPGLTVAGLEPTLGLHGFSFGELIFDDCRVPTANRIGREGDGWKVAYSSSITYGRPNLTAVSLGIHRALLKDTVAYVKQQRRYGRRLADLSIIKDKIGKMRSHLMTSAANAYLAVSMLDRNLPCDTELINAKYQGVELLLESVRIAVDAHGAAALLRRNHIERYLRDAYHMLTPAGTPEIQLLRLAEAELGTMTGQWSEQLADRIATTPSATS